MGFSPDLHPRPEDAPLRSSRLKPLLQEARVAPLGAL
jgi:hypothetical protein